MYARRSAHTYTYVHIGTYKHIHECIFNDICNKYVHILTFLLSYLHTYIHAYIQPYEDVCL